MKWIPFIKDFPTIMEYSSVAGETIPEILYNINKTKRFLKFFKVFVYVET